MARSGVYEAMGPVIRKNFPSMSLVNKGERNESVFEGTTVRLNGPRQDGDQALARLAG